METGKICKLLIVIFFVLTLFFSFMYFNELDSKTVLSDEFVEGAVINLTASGIDISKDIIHAEVPEEEIYVLEIDDINAHNSKIVNTIVEKVHGTNVTTTVFDVPEGASVSIYSAKDTDKELGSIVFSATDMKFEYSKNGVNISGADLPVINDDFEAFSDSKKDIVSSILDKLISGNEIGYRFSGSTGDENLLIVSAIQTVNEYDINNIYMNFVFENDELVAVMGNWFYGKLSAEYYETLVDGVNVLYNLDIDSIKAVHSEEIIYTLRKTDSTFYLIPGWKISYTDKSGKYMTSYFDAL